MTSERNEPQRGLRQIPQSRHDGQAVSLSSSPLQHKSCRQVTMKHWYGYKGIYRQLCKSENNPKPKYWRLAPTERSRQ